MISASKRQKREDDRGLSLEALQNKKMGEETSKGLERCHHGCRTTSRRMGYAGSQVKKAY